MYQFKIKGSDYQKGKVKQIGKAIAVIVAKEWKGADVIVVREGEIEKFEKISGEKDGKSKS